MSVGDMDLGPCAVYFGTEGAEADLGRTQGGVRVAFITDVADLLSDQWGTQPEDGMITGQGARITVPLAEYTLDNIALALNQTVYGGGLIGGERIVGTKMSSKAKSLLLKKYVNGIVSTDAEDWMRFPNAAPEGNPEILFDGSTQRIVEIVFIAYPEATSEDLYYIGDETLS